MALSEDVFNIFARLYTALRMGDIPPAIQARITVSLTPLELRALQIALDITPKFPEGKHPSGTLMGIRYEVKQEHE